MHLRSREPVTSARGANERPVTNRRKCREERRLARQPQDQQLTSATEFVAVAPCKRYHGIRCSTPREEKRVGQAGDALCKALPVSRLGDTRNNLNATSRAMTRGLRDDGGRAWRCSYCPTLFSRSLHRPSRPALREHGQSRSRSNSATLHPPFI
jgi:hypothetical protein